MPLMAMLDFADAPPFGAVITGTAPSARIIKIAISRDIVRTLYFHEHRVILISLNRSPIINFCKHDRSERTLPVRSPSPRQFPVKRLRRNTYLMRENQPAAFLGQFTFMRQ